MDHKLISTHRKTSIDDGMLFVRRGNIHNAMVRASLLVTSILIAALTFYVQPSLATVRSLDIVVYDDGVANVRTEVNVDPLSPDHQHDLFGPNIDNFFAIDKDGTPLSSEIQDDLATITTLGTTNITIHYDIHDLISKKGRTWTFSFDSPTNHTLLLPPNTIIEHMDAFPTSTRSINNQLEFGFGPGLYEIRYVIKSTPINLAIEESDDIPYMYVIIAAISAGIAVVTIYLLRRLSHKPKALDTVSKPAIPAPTESTPSTLVDSTTDSTTETPTVTPPSRLDLILADPEIREDDKKIIKFILDNGGQVLERDLRKRFLQPKTTMWRAVKRLERRDIVEITKRDMQNLVKLKEDIR